MPLANFGVVKKIGEVMICRSAQPDADGYKTLKAIGIESIFKLNNNTEGNNNDEMICATPMTVYNHPLPELFRVGETNTVIEIARLIQTELIKGKSVLIHCSHGRDRTGLVVAAWQLMYDGQTFDEVNKHRWDYGMSLIIDTIDIPDKLILREIYVLKGLGQI